MPRLRTLFGHEKGSVLEPPAYKSYSRHSIVQSSFLASFPWQKCDRFEFTSGYLLHSSGALDRRSRSQHRGSSNDAQAFTRVPLAIAIVIPRPPACRNGRLQYPCRLTTYHYYLPIQKHMLQVLHIFRRQSFSLPNTGTHVGDGPNRNLSIYSTLSLQIIP